MSYPSPRRTLLAVPGRKYPLIEVYPHSKFRGNRAVSIEIGKWSRAYGWLKPCEMDGYDYEGKSRSWPKWLGGMSWHQSHVPFIWGCKHRTNREERERIAAAAMRATGASGTTTVPNSLTRV